MTLFFLYHNRAHDEFLIKQAKLYERRNAAKAAYQHAESVRKYNQLEPHGQFVRFT